MRNAELACRSPPRFSLRRWVLPDDASTALTPRRAAKEALLPIRSGVSPAATGSAAAPTHLYEFGWRSQEKPNDAHVELGACHSLDLPFTWDTVALEDNHKFTGPNPPQVLADALHRAWVDFATTGQVSWPAYGNARRPVMTVARDSNPATHEVVDDPRARAPVVGRPPAPS